MGEGGLFACDIKHSKNIIQKIQDQAILQISSPNPLASLAPLFILKKDGSISLSRIKKLNISRPGSLTNSDHKIIQNQHEFSAGNHFIRQDSSERENYPCKIVLDAMYTSFLNSHSGGSVKKISTQIDRSGSGSRLALLYDHQLSVSSVFEFSKSAEFSIYDHRTINRFEKCSQDVSFAPLENGNLIAMTTDDSLDILDIRCSSAPVFIKKMIDPCRSLRWSPFVAYWIATGDEKGISIHDLRFTPRPGKFASNKEINDVNSRINLKSASTFCWSNSNAELLLVGDATRQISVWSLLCQSGINATHLTSQKLPEIGGDLIDSKFLS